MTTGTELARWLAFSRDNTRLQQFGQSNDVSTFNGATGCTHTVLQRLVKAKTGATYTHDQLSKIATYPWPNHNPNVRGMYSGGSDNEVGRVMTYFRLPYVLRLGLTFPQVLGEAAKGPVMLGIRYGYWPEDRGYVYGGQLADGRPGGYAIRNGKTQLSGAESIYHMVLLLGTADVSGQFRAYANEPNHASPSRPERPDYDTVLALGARHAYEQYGSDGRRLIAWVPTTTFRPRGY